MRDLDWMGDARCAQVDPDLWHPDGSGSTYGDARRICERCPVQRQCTGFAQESEGSVAHSHRHGLWGGELPKERASNSEPLAFSARRHQEIVRLAVSGGMSPQEIADHVGVTVRTVARVTRAHREQMGVTA
jgi:ATP/maltotriose-dependent transcriptional regulator MalT